MVEGDVLSYGFDTYNVDNNNNSSDDEDENNVQETPTVVVNNNNPNATSSSSSTISGVTTSSGKRKRERGSQSYLKGLNENSMRKAIASESISSTILKATTQKAEEGQMNLSITWAKEVDIWMEKVDKLEQVVEENPTENNRARLAFAKKKEQMMQ